jgi:hypothetical protein
MLQFKMFLYLFTITQHASVSLSVPLQLFGFSQQAAICSNVGSRILRTAAFRIATFCDGPLWYRCSDNSPWDHVATELASPTRATVRVTIGSVHFSVLNKWDCLLLCFMEWDTPSVVYFILCFRKISVSYKKNNFHAFYAFWGCRNFYFWSIRSSWNQIGILR